MKPITGTQALALVSAFAFAACSSEESDRGGPAGVGGKGTSGAAGTAGAIANGGTAGIAAANGAGGTAGASGTAGSGGASGTAATGGGATGGANSGGSSGASTGGSSGTTGGASGTTGGVDGGAGSAGMPAQKPYKGVANSPCAARTALNVSWYYNWTTRETEPCSDGRGGEFVPMLWGHPGAEQTATGITSAIANMVSRGYKTVLGFNEPDNPSQSNIPVANAIALWPAFDNRALLVGSPATAANANPGQAWFTNFMNELAARPGLRVDFLAIHWYGWNAGSCDAGAAQLESYVRWAERFAGNRPIWITEWGCLNASAPNPETVVNFFKGAIAMFARHPRIERYAWYPWATNCGLNASSGSLTALGEAYAAAPAFK